jgi:PRC-barrel domain
MKRRTFIAVLGSAAVVRPLTALALFACAGATARADDSPEEIMLRRFPQLVKVGDLIRLPVVDDNQSTLGHVRQVVRTTTGKIQLIVSYSPWFGWWGRPVAVPIEAVGIFGRQLAALDISRQEFEKAPTWSSTEARPIGASDTIRIALTRH